MMDAPRWKRTEVLLLHYLVTRPTGRGLRAAMESTLAELGADGVPVLLEIDFARVRVLDASCADEIVGCLAERLCGPNPPADAYLWLRNVDEPHQRVLQSVLEHRRRLVAADGPTGCRLLGPASEEIRRAWRRLLTIGCADPSRAATDLACEEDRVAFLVGELERQRLARRDRDGRIWACAPSVLRIHVAA